MKADVNEIGRQHGCHTCNTRLEIDRDQPWIGDHFPPTELKGHARKALAELSGDTSFTGNTQLLFPQCHACSGQQSALVRKLNTMNYSDILKWLKADQNELSDVLHLTSGWTQIQKGQTCIPASGKIVSACVCIRGPENSDHRGRKGLPQSPGHDVAALVYHADHTWPQEFCTAYMDEVMKRLNLSHIKPARQELRPQCPRCSGNQGGKMSQIAKKALAYAADNGITFYK
jgi:hypothetical protein